MTPKALYGETATATSPASDQQPGPDRNLPLEASEEQAAHAHIHECHRHSAGRTAEAEAAVSYPVYLQEVKEGSIRRRFS